MNKRQMIERIGKFIDKYPDDSDAEYYDFDEFEFLFQYVHPHEPERTEMFPSEYMMYHLKEYYEKNLQELIDEKLKDLLS